MTDKRKERDERPITGVLRVNQEELDISEEEPLGTNLLGWGEERVDENRSTNV